MDDFDLLLGLLPLGLVIGIGLWELWRTWRRHK